MSVSTEIIFSTEFRDRSRFNTALARILARVGVQPAVPGMQELGLPWNQASPPPFMGWLRAVERVENGDAVSVSSKERETKGLVSWPITDQVLSILLRCSHWTIQGPVLSMQSSGESRIVEVSLGFRGGILGIPRTESECDRFLVLKTLARMVLEEKMTDRVFLFHDGEELETFQDANSAYFVDLEMRSWEKSDGAAMQAWLNIGPGSGSLRAIRGGDECGAGTCGDLIRWDTNRSSYILHCGKEGSTNALLKSCVVTGELLEDFDRTEAFCKLNDDEVWRFKRIGWECGGIGAIINRLEGWFDEYGPIYRSGMPEQIVRSAAFWDVSETCVPIFREFDSGLIRVAFAAKQRR